MGNFNPVLLGIVFMVVAWVAMFSAISRVGGWATLAGQYSCHETFTGPRWSFQQGQMRWMVGYNHCLNIGADPRGLYLSILFPFRIGHPPLFVPWRDISYVSKTFLWVKFVELRLGRETAIPLRISYRLAEKLKSAAESSWPIESVS